jgi:hypothetical protein
MNYTDQEILDLESSLEEVGLSKQVVFAIVEPEGWNQQEFGRFGSFVENTHRKNYRTFNQSNESIRCDLRKI